MSRKSALIFILVGILWGVPYLFIKVAVDETNGYPPAIVVFGRPPPILAVVLVNDVELVEALPLVY